MGVSRRLFRWAVALLLLALFVGYFTFSTFLFSPLERGLEGDVSTVVPRAVDFFVARGRLGELFDGFPRLKVADRIEGHVGWKTLRESPEYGQFLAENDIEAILGQLRGAEQQLPMGLSLASLYGARDVALAGYFEGDDPANWRFALYGTLEFAGKLAFSALRHPRLLPLEEQGLRAEVGENWVALEGGNLPRKLYVARLRDIGIVASSPELIDAAFELEALQGQDSFGQSARYFDHIQNASRSRNRDELEVYFDVRKYLEKTGSSGMWPDGKSQEFTPRLLSNFFQLNDVKELVGVVGFDEGLTLDLRGEFSSEGLTALEKRLYRWKGVDRTNLISRVARFVPADACLFVYLQGSVGDLLRSTIDSLEPAVRENLGALFKNTGRYTSLQEVIDDVSDSLHDRLALVVRPNDYPPDPNGPPNDGQPVFAFALVTWTESESKVLDLRRFVEENDRSFGLQGREPGSPGVFKNFESGFETREYWNQLVPGTGVIATVSTGEHTMITNQFRMLGHLLKTLEVGGKKYPRLSDRGDFVALVQSSLADVNVLVWSDPRGASETLRAQSRGKAKDSIQIDWRLIRAQEEQKILRTEHPQLRRGSLPPNIQKEIDSKVDAILKQREQEIYAEHIPREMAKTERMITYLESAHASLIELSLDPKWFELSVRILAPYPSK